MAAVFFLTFNVIGAFLQGILETGIDKLTVLVDTALQNAHISDILRSLIVDGVFGGVGSVFP